MRKKTTWAASVVRKQLQTCCQHETLSLDTHEPDDLSIESFELPPEIYISPVKDPSTFPSLFRRKSFNVSHVRNLLTTPESQTPYRKSVDSSLPLCAGSAFKPRRLQYVRSSANLVPGDAATPAPMSLPLPSPPHLEASSTPKARVHPKSGPLPLLRHSSVKEGSAFEMGCNSPVKVKKYLSGPLPSLQRKAPLTGSSPSPSPPAIKLISMSGKAKELRGGGPSPTNRFVKVKSSAQALFPTVTTSKLPGMVTQGTLKKAAQLAKVTPVLDRKGSRGSRASREANSRATPVSKPPLVMSNGVSSPNTGRVRSSERERARAAVKIQAAIRGYRARKRYAIELARANNLSGELTDEEHEEDAPSISTRMSRTNPPKPKSTARGSRAGMEQVSKSWNGSLRTAQDCQAILKSKQEAALKRERAMEYAMSRQNWKTGSRSQKSTTPASWVVDNTFPDKPGWVWNWLERAARMGAHNSPNRIFDNDFDNDFDNNEDPVSESLSVKSTVGVCTTELGSAADMEHLTVPMTYPWPLSLRQQHAAGLLQPKKVPLARPSPLKKSEISEAPERNHGSELKANARKKSRRRHPSEAQEVCRSREELSTTAGSCVTSPMSDELSLSKPRFGVRKLKFTEDGGLAEEDEKVRKEGGDGESVGSCVGPLPSLQYRLSSPFAGPRPRTSSQSGLQQQQLRMSNPNSLREAMKVNRQAHGNSQSHHVQRHQVSVALSEDDSAGTTAASVRRPFWRP